MKLPTQLLLIMTLLPTLTCGLACAMKRELSPERSAELTPAQTASQKIARYRTYKGISDTKSDHDVLNMAIEDGCTPVVQALTIIAPHNLPYSSALTHAARYARSDIISLLLTAGADPNLQKDPRDTPLMWTIQKAAVPQLKTRALTALRALLAAGAHHEARALAAAAYHGQVETTQTLLDAGANPNARDSISETALFVAAHRGHIQVARTLLDNGANRTIRTHGLTPAQMAVQHGHHELARMINGYVTPLAIYSPLLRASGKKLAQMIHADIQHNHISFTQAWVKTCALLPKELKTVRLQRFVFEEYERLESAPKS